MCPGALYSVQGETRFRVVKVLAVEPQVVHIRMYKNKFDGRPERVELNTLSLGTIHDAEGFGIGHLPIAAAEFAAWQPVFIQKGSLSKEELEGYEEWKRSGGGVWGVPK